MPLACEWLYQAEGTGVAGFSPTCDKVLLAGMWEGMAGMFKRPRGAQCIGRVPHGRHVLCGCLNNDGARRIDAPGPKRGHKQYTLLKAENESYGQPSTNSPFSRRCTRVSQLAPRCSRRRRSKRAGAPRQPSPARSVLAQAHPTAQSRQQSRSAEQVQRQHARAATQRAAHRQRRGPRSADQEQRRHALPNARESFSSRRRQRGRG